MRKVFFGVFSFLIFLFFSLVGIGVFRKAGVTPPFMVSEYRLFGISMIDYFIDGSEWVRDVFVGLGDKKVQRRLVMERSFYLVESGDDKLPAIIGKKIEDIVFDRVDNDFIYGLSTIDGKVKKYKLTSYFKYISKYCLDELAVLEVDGAIDSSTGKGLENILMTLPYSNLWLEEDSGHMQRFLTDVGQRDFVKVFVDPWFNEAVAVVLYDKDCE